ncbi:hypothetical protein D9M71_302080 [compost metagenome]
MVVSANAVLTGRLGAFTSGQYFELQARCQGGDAFALGVFSQESQASTGSSFGLGSGFSLHDFADDFEAGRQVFLAHTACLAIKGVGQAGQDRVQADARWRVVTQLVAQLAANAVADAGFVGGQIYFGHETAPL